MVLSYIISDIFNVECWRDLKFWVMDCTCRPYFMLCR